MYIKFLLEKLKNWEGLGLLSIAGSGVGNQTSSSNLVLFYMYTL